MKAPRSVPLEDYARLLEVVEAVQRYERAEEGSNLSSVYAYRKELARARELVDAREAEAMA